MARKARVLTGQERKSLQTAILKALPGPKSKAITRPLLMRKMEGLLQRRRIPAIAVIREIAKLRGLGRLRVSTKVGMWVGGPEFDPPAPKPGEKSTDRRGIHGQPYRRVRRVVAFVCTRCYAAYPSKAEAKGHHAAAHPKAA